MKHHHICVFQASLYPPQILPPHPTPPPPYLLKMHDEQKMLVLFKIIFQVLIPACIGIETLEKQTSDCMDNLVT